MQEVLVLNNSYLPIGRITQEKAITLLYLQRAIIVKKSGKVMRSVNTQIDIPEVISLPNVSFVKIQNESFSKKNIFKRDKNKCSYCGRSGNLTIDHIIPKKRWKEISLERNLDYGLNSYRNLTSSCLDCNQYKSDFLLEEIGWELPEPKAYYPLLDVNWESLFG